MKKALLVHHDCFESNLISKILFELNYSITIVKSSNLKDKQLKEVKNYNIIVFLGGNASANCKSISMLYEVKFIKKIIKYNVPILGICLGAQLLAKLFGSKITNNKLATTEIGYKKLVKPNSKYFSKNDLFFMQFHSQGISLNKSIEVLAYARLFEVDAFKIIDKEIYGFQFHPEVDDLILERWYKTNKEPLSKYKDSLYKIIKNYHLYKKNNYKWLKKTIIKIST